MVVCSGMCSLLPYGKGIYHYAFYIFLFLFCLLSYIFLQSCINKLDAVVDDTSISKC